MIRIGQQKIAERYVGALMQAAKAALSSVDKDMKALEAAFAEEPQAMDALNNPLLPRADQEKAVEALMKRAHAHSVTEKFLKLLARHRRLELLPAILIVWAKKMAAQRGELNADIATAAPLAQNELREIASKVAGWVGRPVNVTAEVKPELLGGMVLTIGSKQWDGSVAGKLARLEQNLKMA